MKVSQHKSNSLRFMAATTEQVIKQQELIAGLRKQGRSTAEAAAALKKLEASLQQIKNHVVIMDQLTGRSIF